MSSLALPALATDGGLVRYLDEIRRFPVLTVEEEFMLAKRWREHGDVGAAHRLVTSHLRLVAKIAMGYRHYGLPISDLIGEGNVGLMRAVKKFEPDKGFRLSTYAMWWIKAQLHEYVLASWSMVKIGTLAAHRKLFFNLRRLKAKLSLADAGDLSPEAVRSIATDLGVPVDDVVMMNRRMQGRDASLNTPVSEGGGEIQDFLVDGAENQETILEARQESGLRRRLLAAGLDTLNERERHIVTERHLTEAGATLEDLGRHYGISRERVRQIEARAMAKLTAHVREAAAA
ncbi:MAG: RNA polymerase sigma factor RpoH [Alphaproteobacteria bacterium]|nr:RNA polymerase sigma factor RpoH [Alphaproteobacteria bacterium]